MQAQDGLNVVIEHFFVNGFQRKLTPASAMSDLVDLGEVSFTDDVAYVILATEVWEHAKVLQEVEPFL